MKCQLCKNGKTEKGRVTVTLERGNTVVLIKNVPADICDNCGEFYLDEETTYNILCKAENAAQNNAEVEILQYAA
ncbi:MAG: type II toxin-antitoxin system MqsA family antitoxin [Melioribacteraceae bacterium]|nr:type II toxin-antitoxin system MqsA family antitoxin [Saprospiraceae bacterium]MCF8355759.1 type II toxin-antitoxin system MqsA family antitoxin [Melioribacteraceae bacterium]MCF8394787.1 type II toxin-antitoxin system MqsA family antitoxin [Melioribacteraceae bacterium]